MRQRISSVSLVEKYCLLGSLLVEGITAGSKSRDPLTSFAILPLDLSLNIQFAVVVSLKTI